MADDNSNDAANATDGAHGTDAGGADHGGGHSPLDQFEIKPLVDIQLFGVDLSFTNSSLWMMIAVSLVILFFLLSTRKAAMVPGYIQLLGEMIFNMVVSMVKDNVGKEGKAYFPFIFSLFMFILFGNLLGLFPKSFTFTSHIIVNFFISSLIFMTVTVIGIVKHRIRFLRLFFPEGTPLFLAPILVPIELLSYLSRPVSLAVRLFANMVVGHVLLKVIAGFVILMGVFGIVPFVGLIAITALEFLVAFIQAYVFAILTCIYLHDALHLH